MKGRDYIFDKAAFAKQARRYCAAQPKWKWVRLAAVLCFAAGLAVIAFFVPFAIGQDLEGIVLILAAALIFAAIPLCAGYVVWSLGRREIGAPFTRMREMFLFTNHTGIQFGYRDVRSENPYSRIVYQIGYDSIRCVRVDEAANMIVVVGDAEFLAYENMPLDRIRRRDAVQAFSFFGCFDGREEFLANLRAQNVFVR